MFIKKNFFSLCLYITGFIILLSIVYNYYISNTYHYMGFTGKIGNFAPIILIILSIVFTVRIIPIGPYRIFLCFQFLVPILGILILYIGNVSSNNTLFVTSYAFFSLVLFYFIAKFLRFEMMSCSKESLVYVSLFFIILYIFILINQRGVFNIVISLREVYSYRSDFSSSYGASMIKGVAFSFLCVFFAYSLVLKRRYFCLCCIIFCILFFIYSGHKKFIFLIPLFFAANAVSKDYSAARLFYLFFLLMIASLILKFLLNNDFILSAIIRRVFFIPSLLTDIYINHFDVSGYLYFSNSKIGFLLGTYDSSIPSSAKLIGDQYIGEGANANVNWIGAGYMNAGLLGVTIYAFAISILFSMVDNIKNNEVKRIFFVSGTIVYSSFMQNSDLISSFLTNGVLAFLIIVILWGGMNLKRV